MTLSLVFPFCFKCCGVVLYILSLEVACELSYFCKIACWSKVVGPHCPIILPRLNLTVIVGYLEVLFVS